MKVQIYSEFYQYYWICCNEIQNMKYTNNKNAMYSDSNVRSVVGHWEDWHIEILLICLVITCQDMSC